MKKIIFLAAIILFIAQCKKDETTQTTDTSTQTTKTKTPLDYEIDYSVNVNYTIVLISGNHYSVGLNKSASYVSDATITITQGNKTLTAKTGSQGIVSFSGVYKGLIAVNIQKGGYTELNYLVTADGSVATANGKQIDIGNIIPIFKYANDPAVAFIKGKLSYETDLTNLTREVVPASTRVTATIDADDATFKSKYLSISSDPLLQSLNSGKIVQFSYESFFYDSTNIDGDYSIQVPAAIAGLPFNIISSDIVNIQKVFESEAGSGFNRTANYRTIFSPIETPSDVPAAGGAEVVFISGSGALASANISGNGQVDRINITNGGSGYVANPKVVISGGGGNGALATATVTNGVVTSINITNGGNGYSAEPTVTIISGTGGSIAATIGGSGSVISANVTNSGNGYISTPNIIISAPNLPSGINATATANMLNGRVSSITITNSGSGYTSNPTITIDPAPTGGINATSQAVFSGLSVQTLSITNSGSGYTGNPVVVISDPNITSGIKATAIAQVDVNTGQITGVSLTNPGSGYTSSPTVTINSGSGATAQAVFSGRSVTGITLINGGQNYNSAPTVKITGGGGTGAQATAIVSGGRITGFNIINPGTGYIFAPTIELISGKGAQASVQIANGQVSKLNIINGGSGYTGSPIIQINPLPANGPGGGATATANVDLTTGSITNINITNPGAGYIGGNVPSISIPYMVTPSLNNSKLIVKPGLTYFRDIYYGTGKKIAE